MKGIEIMDCMTLMQLLVPESNQLLKIRFQILRAIQRTQPIGRRGLAKQLEISERILRSETDILKEQGLITVFCKRNVCDRVRQRYVSWINFYYPTMH